MCWHLVSTNKEVENEDNHCKGFVDNRVIQIYNENKKLFEDTKDELKLYNKLLLEQKQYRNTSTWFDFDPINTL